MIARLSLLLLLCAASVAHASPGSTARVSTAEASRSARPGPDDKRRIVGILDVRVEGVPKEIQRQFQSDLENQLDSREYWLAGEQRMRELMANSTKWTEGCFVGKCLTEVKTQTGADLVLLASITGAGTSFGYVVTLMRTDTGNVLAQEASRCEVCTVNEVLASATLAAVKLLTAVPDKLPDEAAEQSAALDLATKNLQAEVRHAEGHSRAMGIALTLVGVVAAGAGMTAYLAMDKPTSALAGAGVGAGLALGGVVVLTF
ncbi:MAG TPA: hypothetical protein VFS15_24585 [Kofleriaceae bacterium]|nr:hypothetical protein [Kofleriaceae bacterium]